VNGQYVQNVVGAPIYVPQPYAAPYGVPQLRGVGAALPFGFEVFAGTEFDVGGDLKDAKATGPSEGGGGRAGGFVRQYVGNNVGFRPYVGASAGFGYNNDVDLVQNYNDDGSLFGEQQFIQSGWSPTAAGVVGAEMESPAVLPGFFYASS